MRVAVSSDWHGNLPSKTDRRKISECDLLLLAGDIFSHITHYNYQVLDPIGSFLKELTDNKIPVVMTPGNHDFQIYNAWLDQNPKSAEWIAQHTIPRMSVCTEKLSIDFLKEFLGITVLIDSQIEINGLKIYGTPWTPEFYRWAFMLEEDDLHEAYDRIPSGLDILLSHGPPWVAGFNLDTVLGDKDRHCGSLALTAAISRAQPRFMFCGHIHTGDHDETIFRSTSCRNVSLLNENYMVEYSPFILEI